MKDNQPKPSEGFSINGRTNNSKRFFLLIFCCIIILILCRYTLAPSSPMFGQSLEEKVIKRNGYQVILKSKSESVNFIFNKNMVPEQAGQTKFLNQELKITGSSRIVLDKVVRQSGTGDIYVYLKVIQHMQNPDQGEFVYTDLINEDGTYGNTGMQWTFNNNGQIIKVPHGSGTGPGTSVSVHLKQEELNNLNSQFEINCTDFCYITINANRS